MNKKAGKMLSQVLQNIVTPFKKRYTFSIPVLCYHSWTINGESYGSNDHVALESDLRALSRRGYKILPVPALVAYLLGELPVRDIKKDKLVCLTFDDGRDFDYFDCHHDVYGYVPSFHTILKKSKEWLPQHSDGPRAISFVIASPEARDTLDRTCGEGRKEWNDSWWKESIQTGLLGIANHSWDHVHDTLETVRQRDNKKGSFWWFQHMLTQKVKLARPSNFLWKKLTIGLYHYLVILMATFHRI